MSGALNPPAWAEWVFMALLPADRAECESGDLLEVYRERQLAHSNTVRGSVASAAPLAAEKIRALESSLSLATGKKVQLQATVDPTLIGGLVARIGSTVYDGSIRTQLQRLRQRLVENA